MTHSCDASAHTAVVASPLKELAKPAPKHSEIPGPSFLKLFDTDLFEPRLTLDYLSHHITLITSKGGVGFIDIMVAAEAGPLPPMASETRRARLALLRASVVVATSPLPSSFPMLCHAPRHAIRCSLGMSKVAVKYAFRVDCN